MKNIIFIAPPAAGKGTQSKLVSLEYNIPHISTGDLLRDEISQEKRQSQGLWLVPYRAGLDCDYFPIIAIINKY